MTTWLSVILVVGLTGAAPQAQGWQLREIDPQLTLLDAHGEPWRLAGIEIIDQQATRTWLQSLANLSLIALDEDLGFDRYGARFVHLGDTQGGSVQTSLLREGWAVCRPDLAMLCPTEWMIAEKQARRERAGIWSGGFALDAARASQGINSYALVGGRILHSAETRRYVYLNFGKVWKTDFTIRIPNREAKAMAKQGLDLLALEGRIVEVRGFAFEENGPMIELTEPAALEILE